MATSNAITFNPEIAEICEEAFERCGLQFRTGYDLRTARRSLNFLFLELTTLGLNLWQLEEVTLALSANDGNYTLPADTVDVMEAAIRTGSGSSQTDIAMTRIGMSQYSNIPNKNSTGRPVQFFVDRRTGAPVINVWPIPNDNSYTLVYWRIRRVQDAGANGGFTMDVPPHFIPAVVAGLAYHISIKRVKDAQLRLELKQSYTEAVAASGSEDRDRSSFYITPDLG